MPDRDPLTGVPPSRHPFQFWVLVGGAISGAATAFELGQPNTLNSLLPNYIVVLWGWTLMIGGLLGISAAWWKDRITGLLIERVALGAVGGAMVIYGTVLFIVGGSAAFVAGSLCLGTSFASFWRIVHVNRELKVLMRWIERNL